MAIVATIVVMTIVTVLTFVVIVAVGTIKTNIQFSGIALDIKCKRLIAK